MQSIRSFSPVLRAIGVIGVVAALVTSITFAALQSSATLTDNTINSATASLLVSNDDTTFDTTATGFLFDDAVPGGDAVPSTPHTFQLRNAGDVDFDVWVAISSTPAVSGDLDKSLVDVIFTCTTDSFGDVSVTASLQDMIDGPVAMGPDVLVADDDADCTAQAQMQAGAVVSGSEASISDVDFEFTGVNSAEAS